ncbi:hypothetical protein FQA39_LY17804 [Lamprigera yunnana]|nr:hypothetical protein FQA39_LY17804 [Lamprigera yunnana]
MDCFYCQVEENLDPNLKGKPLAVVQYNAWRGGGIIAVNYAARAKGVTRHMRGDEAKKHCPEIILAKVPSVRGKADLTKYRNAGKLVANVLQNFTDLLERASVDEAYLDITKAVKERKASATNKIQLSEIINTHVVGSSGADFLHNLYNNDLCEEGNDLLAYGAVIVEEIRAAVFQRTGYTCSAGIAHNKILAKLACGLNKPNKQTILPQESVQHCYENLPVYKIRSLGGKFGQCLSEDLGIANMAELEQFSETDLRKRYDDKTANWLYKIARGIDTEPVTTRLIAKSIGCCKRFPGKQSLNTIETVMHWINELAAEISERLEIDFTENNRKAKQTSITFSQTINGTDVTNSRVNPLTSYEVNKIADDTFGIIKKHCMRSDGSFCITFLGISATKFEEYRKVNEITRFFKIGASTKEGNKIVAKSVSTPNAPLDLNIVLKKEDGDSDTTIDLNEDSSGLIFWNENESKDNNGEGSMDSISNELDDDTSNKESFFLQYFEKMKEQKPNRDFDTSRILEVGDDEEDLSRPNTSSESDKGNEVCEECFETIPKSEMDIHKDYHFALKVNQEESKNPCKASMVNKKNTERSKSKKRKVTEQNSLTKFLTNPQELGENARLCTECNKKVAEGDYNCHMDYHIAKRLHMKINPIETMVTSTAKKSKKGNEAVSSTKTLSSFFKHIN